MYNINSNSVELKEKITVNSRKFNGDIKRTWEAILVENDNTLLTLYGTFNKEVVHSHLGIIKEGTISYEFYWLDKFYNIFLFYQPEGNFRNYYCNINLPPVFENGVLDYIDLEIDLIVYEDLSYKIIDEEEFREHSKIYNYPESLISKTNETVEEIISLVNKRQFPFNLVWSKKI